MSDACALGAPVQSLKFELGAKRAASPAQVQTIYNFKTDQAKVDDEF